MVRASLDGGVTIQNQNVKLARLLQGQRPLFMSSVKSVRQQRMNFIEPINESKNKCPTLYFEVCLKHRSIMATSALYAFQPQKSQREFAPQPLPSALRHHSLTATSVLYGQEGVGSVSRGPQSRLSRGILCRLQP